MTLVSILPIIFILEIFTVIGLSFFSTRVSGVVAVGLFLFYSLMNGLFFGVITLAYPIGTIAAAFFATFITFAVMAVYGFVTKQDLTKFGTIAMFGLFGLIVASIINLFAASSALDWFITYFGLGIFIVLTAFDNQKIKNMAAAAEMSGRSTSFAIRGALMLYLDFINIFIYILRILGGSSRK